MFYYCFPLSYYTIIIIIIIIITIVAVGQSLAMDFVYNDECAVRLEKAADEYADLEDEFRLALQIEADRFQSVSWRTMSTIVVVTVLYFQDSMPQTAEGSI